MTCFWKLPLVYCRLNLGTICPYSMIEIFLFAWSALIVERTWHTRNEVGGVSQTPATKIHRQIATITAIHITIETEVHPIEMMEGMETVGAGTPTTPLYLGMV